MSGLMYSYRNMSKGEFRQLFESDELAVEYRGLGRGTMAIGIKENR